MDVGALPTVVMDCSVGKQWLDRGKSPRSGLSSLVKHSSINQP